MTETGGYAIAIDTGGTFTDLVIDTGEELRMHKATTTPSDPTRGILDVIAVAAEGLGISGRELLAGTELLIHGTTHAINALITHQTARTAFLTTRGHPDILLFREGGRADAFDFSVPYPDPLVPRALTFEVPERVASDGTELEPLDEVAVIAILEQLKARGVEAVAVCLLWSIVAPAHEVRVGELIAEQLPGVPYTLSHALNPTVREYRRASSTCIDASLKPLMSSYFAGLDQRLAQAGFGGRLLIVTSQGGTLDAADVAQAPIHAINSGPAMAPVAGRCYAGLDTGARTAIIADTGGTTFDVSLVRDGHIPRTSETWLGPEYQGHITGFPSVDVTSVGAGGGSIAWVDEAGLLCVGPHSAGSEPGPACYGRGGTAATVTDACLLLGYIDPDYFLAGRMRLDADAAAAALVREVAEPLRLELHQAALAVLRIATENMVHAIEEITINQGIDPREAVLVGGGGAAGLNLVAIARQLGCRQVLLPETGAALSAAGALLAELSADFAVTSVVRTDSFEPERVQDVISGLKRACLAFAARSRSLGEPRIELSFDGRYLRQNWDLEAPMEDRIGTSAATLADGFHRMHQRVFAISEPGSPVQITTWRARVNCRVNEVTGRRLVDTDAGAPPRRRPVMFQDARWHDTPVLALSTIGERASVAGPAIIESPFTTLVLDPGMTARRTPSGSLLIKPSGVGPGASATGSEIVAVSDDPVALAVVASRLRAVVRKMSNTLYRTGRSGVLNTARDFSCAIVSAQDELLMAADSLPIHVLSGPDLLTRSMRAFHPELRAGDAYLHNSPYHGNSHPADHCLLVPVIDAGGRHHFTVLVKAHQADCGNSLPTTYMGAAADVYAEGALIFPAVKVQTGYSDIDDIIRICQARIRVPEQWRGDYLAMVGAARIGERELLAIGEELGFGELRGRCSQWLDYSEQRMIAALRRLPAGEAEASATHDPYPGAPEGIPVTARLRTDPQDARVEIDLRDNPDSYPCGLNLSEACARTAALIGVFNSLPETIPTNAGSLRRIDVHLRRGCVVGIPEHPTSVSVATTNVADRVTSCVQMAFARIDPRLGMAEPGPFGAPSAAVISGIDGRAGATRFVNQIFLMLTGGAGGPQTDGWLTLCHAGNGGMLFVDSVEIDELNFPLVVHEQRLDPDTEGAGRRRGAPSARVEYGPLDGELALVYASDGHHFAAQGTLGGLSGAGSTQLRRTADGRLEPLPGQGEVTLRRGETVVVRTAAGGGFGPPSRREPERVARDVTEGWISQSRAREVYRVAMNPDGTVDPLVTDQLRKGGDADV